MRRRLSYLGPWDVSCGLWAFAFGVRFWACGLSGLSVDTRLLWREGSIWSFRGRHDASLVVIDPSRVLESS